MRNVAPKPPTWALEPGDCLELLKQLPDACIDSVVTDPPYELGFMGKKWDASGIAYRVDLWREVLRVLKPGGHLLAFGGTRTYHRMACAIEDAGFEVRDSLHWVYGSGFPKSLDVSKAIDDKLGATREVIGTGPYASRRPRADIPGAEYRFGPGHASTAPATPAAKQWQGWGTALKPAHEPIVLARKPLIGTVAENVLEHGTGGINVDAGRIATSVGDPNNRVNPTKSNGLNSCFGIGNVDYGRGPAQAGRWPANILFSHAPECVQVGTRRVKGSGIKEFNNRERNGKEEWGYSEGTTCYTSSDGTEEIPAWECAPGCPVAELDRQSEGSSRFFYVAKTSRKEREAGCENLLSRTGAQAVEREPDTAGLENPRAGAGRTAAEVHNYHPTVKPIALMRYLVRLVTPPTGEVLDPFAGSGTTGCAAILEGFGFIGFEREQEYVAIAEARIKHYEALAASQGATGGESRKDKP